jgi:hypothetical protein
MHPVEDFWTRLREFDAYPPDVSAVPRQRWRTLVSAKEVAEQARGARQIGKKPGMR